MIIIKMIEELEKLFKYIKSKDREISELYLQLALEKYEILIIEDYVFRFEYNISIENSLIPGLKHIIIRTSQSNIYDYKNVYHYEYDTMTGQFMNPYVNPLK